MPGQPMMGQPMMGQPMPGQPMMGQPMMGQPMPGQPMMGQPMMGQPMMGQPMGGPIMVSGTTAGIAASAKRGMWMTAIIMAVTIIPITAILLFTFVDFSGDDVCEKAAACCKKVSGGVADSACNNFKKNMPVEGCRMALDNYKNAPGGKKCE